MEIVAYYKKIYHFAYYFDLYGEEEEEEKEKEENEDNDSFSNSENYESYNSHIHDYNDILPQYDVDKYYDKYIYLKYLSLLIFDDSTSQEIFEKNIKCVKITNNIIKCYYYKNESSDFEFNITESFFYDLNNQKRFRIQANIDIFRNDNYFNFDYDNNDFEKI